MKIGIVGYGNLGRGLAERASLSDEFSLVGIFSRRNLTSPFSPVFKINEISSFKGRLDCLLLAGGSSSDLPKYTPLFAKDFNVVDSFDDHKRAKEHFERVDAEARAGKRSAIISAGWDPGIFSIFRLLTESFLFDAKTSSFWGRGVSQGHSEAIRKIDGVKNAIQYTIPKKEAIKEALRGIPQDDKKSHVRECFVVAESSSRQRKIEEKIKAIPGYFEGYQTKVNFISEKELLEEHTKLYHGGRVISLGKVSAQKSDTATMDLSLKMTSNPGFTAGIMLAYARAAKRFFDIGDYGAKTPLEVPPSFVSTCDLFKLL